MRKYLKVNRANSIIERFGKSRVLVIGDLIMDHFIWGKVKRISPEAPVPVVEVTSEDLMLGGSANVANNISSLGGLAMVAGVVGNDYDGGKLKKALRKKGLPTAGVITDPRRPTTIKTRIIAHNQQVVRFDREKLDKIGPATFTRVLNYIRKAIRAADVVVISDYAKGLITKGLVQETRALCKKFSKPVAVDPGVEHFGYYTGVGIVTPNNLEASLASGIEITDEKSLHTAGEVLLNKLGCEALLITRGEHGMSLFEPDSDVHVPTVAREVYDVSGAGDTVVGVLALALAAGANFREAAVLANFAAGVVVGKIGTATVTKTELKEAVRRGLKSWPRNH
jgi:D-beta-D-heptose 7-phosphate kinase/D-beta-D-heptose 1-phosphate adenosyltransferase